MGKNEANVRKYRTLSPIYDFFARNPLIEKPRQRQFELAASGRVTASWSSGWGRASISSSYRPTRG